MIKINKAFIVGRMTKEPEENGKAIKFTLVVQRDYKNTEGQYENDFIRCVAFGQTGNFIKEYCHKGDLIGIDGQITTSKYEKDGKTMYNTEIMANKTRKLSNNTNTTPKQESSLKEPKNELEQNIKDMDLGW